MKTVSTRVFAILALAAVLSVGAFAQAQPNNPFPDQAVFAGISFDQNSTPQVSGFVAYGKLVSANGVYSYTKISETSVSIKPQITVQTQTESGVCAYVTKFGAFDLFGCATGGLAVAGDSKGLSGSGNTLVTKSIGRGWTAGLSFGPSYSGATKSVSYPLSLVFGWGK